MTRTTAARTRARRRSRSDWPCPPCNIGPRSTPDYALARRPAVATLSSGETRVFAGQRVDAFSSTSASIFDLATLRPFQSTCT